MEQKMEQKELFKVIWIKNNKIIFESGWVMAKNKEAAKFWSVDECDVGYDEETRILCCPFC